MFKDYSSKLIEVVEWESYLKRPFSLFGTSLWKEWYISEKIESLFGFRLTKALYIQEKSHNVQCFFSKKETVQLKKIACKLVKERPDYCKEVLEQGIELNSRAEKCLAEKVELSLQKAIDFYTETAVVSTIFPFFIGQFLDETVSLHKELITLRDTLRHTSLYPSILEKMVLPSASQYYFSSIKDEHLKQTELLTIEEILKKDITVQNPVDVHIRKDKCFMYAYVDGEVVLDFVDDTELFINDLQPSLDNALLLHEVKGQPAFQGRVTGVVRVIYSHKDNKELNEGDILVTINSNPTLISYIKKAGAIITDEGGITCHAAIISRELKIPCVIGTKIATKVLNDGDIVEVDADKGVVRILERP